MPTFTCKCHWCGKELIRKTQSVHVEFHFCDRTCKGEFQKTGKPVTKDWLYEHYIVKGLDTTQIGHMVKRDPKSVWNWLKDFGIPTRPRGGNTLPHAFKKGGNEGGKNPFFGRKHTDETRRKLSDQAKADGRVPYDPSVGPYCKGKSGADTPGWKGGITKDRPAFYRSKEWKRIEKAVKERDGDTCRRCGKVKRHDEKTEFHTHHIVSFECVELRCDIGNVVVLCKPCHDWVHSKKNVNKEFIKEIPS